MIVEMGQKIMLPVQGVEQNYTGKITDGIISGGELTSLLTKKNHPNIRVYKADCEMSMVCCMFYLCL